MDAPLNDDDGPLGGSTQVPQPPQPGTYGPLAFVLKVAAQTSQPLCGVPLSKLDRPIIGAVILFLLSAWIPDGR
ncbi:MAG: hypothetical protein ACOYMG_26740 [Candidatus Methylumidiphilus sp.]